MSFLYILHFDRRICHAGHYAGCSENLKQRLLAHACGCGSRITRAFYQQGIAWTLGGLFSTTASRMRQIERSLKDRHDTPNLCSICSPHNYCGLPGTVSYPIDLLPFPTRSTTLKAAIQPAYSPSLSVSNPENFSIEIEQIIRLMKSSKDALGFIPAGSSTAGMDILFKTGRIILAKDAGKIIGYCAFTQNPSRTAVRAHQLVVADGFRLMGHGRTIIELIKDAGLSVTARVRDDLPANEFWVACGFQLVGQHVHQTSGSKINHYLFPAYTEFERKPDHDV